MLRSLRGQRPTGRPRVSWLDNITAWKQSAFEQTSRNPENRKQWRRAADNAIDLAGRRRR